MSKMWEAYKSKMMIKTGKCCNLCNIIFKGKKEALDHFIKEHPDVAIIKLSEFITSEQYFEDEN